MIKNNNQIFTANSFSASVRMASTVAMTSLHTLQETPFLVPKQKQQLNYEIFNKYKMLERANNLIKLFDTKYV